MKNYITFLLILPFFISCKNENNQEAMPVQDNDMAQQDSESLSPEQEEAREIAMASGLESWDEVEEIKFTFNVDRGENHMERHWTWNPKTQDISMRSEKDSISYNRESTMDSTATNADKGFINDAYWLLPQMHLVWDESASLSVQDTATAPISGDKMKMITITYPEEGGYTPGDAYDFYYDKDYKIQEWIYRRGNAKEASMTTTWEDYKDYEGIDIATTHHTEDKSTKLYFTNIEVKTE